MLMCNDEWLLRRYKRVRGEPDVRVFTMFSTGEHMLGDACWG